MHERVLVTGGAGFIGPHVVKLLLERGSRVTTLDNHMTGRPENLQALPARPGQLTALEVDVRDGDAVARAVEEATPDAAIHLAAIHYIPYCNENPHEAMDVNVGGTLNVLDALAQAGVAKVVCASSAAVYPIFDGAATEDLPVAPTDIYGATKASLEALSHRFAAETGASISSARLFNVYGPGETNPHVLPDIFRQLDSASPVRLGNISPKRDYVHVSDVARAFVALLDHPHQGHRAFNVGTGSEYSVQELIDTLGALSGRTIEILSVAGRKRRLDRPHLLANAARIAAETGWSAQVSLEQGLQTLIDEAAQVARA